MLVDLLDLIELFPEGSVVGKGRQLGQLLCVGAEAVADGLGNERGQRRVGLQQPAAVGNAVGDGAELLLIQQVKVVEQGIAENFAVELAHAVNAEAHRHAQVRHMHLTVADDGHVTDALPLVGVADEQVGAQAAVQLLQNHVDAGKGLLHHVRGPAFQRLGHDSVVGVGHATLGDTAGHIPVQPFLIDQQADQFGNCQTGMGVVDVEDALVRQQIKVVAIILFEILQRVLQGGAGEEVMLLQPQHFAFIVLVFGVQHLGDHFGHLHFFHGLHVLAFAEGAQVDALLAAGAPCAQGVDTFVIIADDGHIVGHRVDGVRADGAVAFPAVFFVLFYMAAKLNLAGVLGSGNFPYVAVGKPVVRQLHLLAVHHLLAEQAVLVTDGCAHGRQAFTGETVHEAGCQTAQTAVAQRGFRLLGQHVAELDAQFIQRLGVKILTAKIDEIAVQAAAHQKFNGKIIDPLAMLLMAFFAGNHPAIHDLVAGGGSDGAVQLLGRCLGHGNAVIALQFADDTVFNGFNIESGGWHEKPPLS